tara:strand:- start:49082 stop:49246 length:165 start_codon:yes stop_codon:yes gene_type:complete
MDEQFKQDYDILSLINQILFNLSDSDKLGNLKLREHQTKLIAPINLVRATSSDI